MTTKPTVVDLNPRSMETLPCCGVKNPSHAGRLEKNCWLGKHFDKGLRARVLLTPDKRQCGYIEYLPGEYAWRGVEARGYLFIHCIWTFYKEYKGKGHAAALLRTCVEDARETGMNGVAVVARDGPWLAGPALFEKAGFTAVDTAPPDYQLLVLKLDPSAANPAFKQNWEEKLKKFSDGLTIIRASQCPHVAKFADEIAVTAEKEYGLKPRVVELKSWREAQNAPTPYAVFAVIHDGQLLADHQISRTRFRNIMKRLPI